MSCEFAATTVHAYLDSELDAVRCAEFERHVESCSECQSALETAESLRARLRAEMLYEPASPRFRAVVRTRLGLKQPSRTVWRPGYLAAAAAVLLAVGALAVNWLVFQPRAQTAQLAAELVDAHVRSLQPGHLTDVQSSDQHTVKPWFDGKLAFIPPVGDFAAEGYPLLGGRLDVVGGQTIAALAYGHRKHIVSLFVWPAHGADKAAASGTRQGYHWILWRAGEMEFCLVSDTSSEDLRELQSLIQ